VLDSSNVRVAVTRAISMAPVGAPEPVDADARLDAAFADLGYVSEDGVTETRERSTEQLRAWQNAAVVRESVTEATLRYQFVLIETKRETVEAYYGETVDPGDGSIPIIPANTGGRHAFVIDVSDDFIRAWLPTAEVTEVGDQVYANGQPIGYEVLFQPRRHPAAGRGRLIPPDLHVLDPS
jgi:hypothetical protein